MHLHCIPAAICMDVALHVIHWFTPRRHTPLVFITQEWLCMQGAGLRQGGMHIRCITAAICTGIWAQGLLCA